jgi:hypothetical protein
MILDVETVRDFLKYYGSRYLKGRDGLPYYCQGPSGDDIARNQISVYKPKAKLDEWKQETVPFSQVDGKFLFGLYRLGTLAIGDELLYLSYYPTREGYRGLDANRIYVHSFNGAEVQEHGAGAFNLDNITDFRLPPSAVKALLFPVRYTLQEAIRVITEGGVVAVALEDPSFGIYQSAYNEHPYLTYKNDVVGEIKEGFVEVLDSFNKIKMLSSQQIGITFKLPNGGHL